MNNIELMRLAQVLVLRADTTDIMDISGIDLLEAERTKLALIGYLQDQESLERFSTKELSNETV